MRRVGALAFLLGSRGVSGAIFDANFKTDFGDGCLQLAFDISRERLERRDIERVQPDMRLGEFTEGRQKTRKGFAPARGGDQQLCG